MAPRSRRASKAVAIIVDDDSMDVDEPEVRLRTCDGKRFTLTKSEASCSNALRAMMEGSQTTSEYVNLPAVHSQVFTKVIEWCQMHCRDEHSNAKLITLTELDKAYFQAMSEIDLLRLLHVASFLDVRSLFNAGCQIIGKRWEGKKVDELRKMYNLENDFTPEEESQMLKDTKALGINESN